MNETLTVFMISEIERLREEGREPARRIYHNMLRTLRESAGKEEIGFEEVTPVFLGKYEHWLLGKRLSWNTVSTYMRALRAGYNRGMKGRPGYVTGLFDKVYTGTRSDVKRAVDARTVGRMIRMSGCPDESASAKAVDWFVLMFMLRGIPFVDLAHLRRSIHCAPHVGHDCLSSGDTRGSDQPWAGTLFGKSYGNLPETFWG